MKRTWPIEHLDCPNCAAKLENALRKLPGVESVSVNFTGGTVTIPPPDNRMPPATRPLTHPPPPPPPTTAWPRSPAP